MNVTGAARRAIILTSTIASVTAATVDNADIVIAIVAALMTSA